MTEEKQDVKRKKKSVVAIGKRKKAVAQAVVREGKGVVRINDTLLDVLQPRYKQMRIKEALLIAGQLANEVSIDVTVRGGGSWGQADAARTAIANALVLWSKDEQLRYAYLDYDRSLLVSDSRRTEPHKPSRSSAGPRRSKQQSKR
ncbi:MAG: 30S ribosomal protein S9 [Candidatus Aenigmarchaeota archaeon]|nr:30S ribosomal protein S9 [Candidatus Aenigmarchaeota archaeon]